MFIPEDRCQFNSAFMYIYVDYLEKKMKEKNETTKENGDSEQKQNNLEEDHLKEDKKEETKGKGIFHGIKNLFGKEQSKEKEDKEDKEKKRQKKEEIEKEKKRIKENFKYTAYKMIKEFLTKEIDI